jgi:hypothetical protein
MGAGSSVGAVVANEEHVALLKQGVDAWNAWRRENLDVPPDLSEADLSGANLSWAALFKANLFKANLRRASLREADLSGTNLREANLSRADRSGADPSEAARPIPGRWREFFRRWNADEREILGKTLSPPTLLSRLSRP